MLEQHRVRGGLLELFGDTRSRLPQGALKKDFDPDARPDDEVSPGLPAAECLKSTAEPDLKLSGGTQEPALADTEHHLAVGRPRRGSLDQRADCHVAFADSLALAEVTIAVW